MRSNRSIQPFRNYSTVLRSERLTRLATLTVPAAGPAIARKKLFHTTSGVAKRHILEREELRHFLPWYDSSDTEFWPYPSASVRFRQLVLRGCWRGAADSKGIANRN